MNIFIDEDKARHQQNLTRDTTLYDFAERNLIDQINTFNYSSHHGYVFNSKCREIWSYPHIKNAPNYNNILPNSQEIFIDVMTLHRLNDPRALILTAKEMIKPQGIFITTFLGGDTLKELRETLIATDLHFYNGAYQRLIPMIQSKSVCDLAQACGLQNFIVDHKKIEFHYQGLRDLIFDLKQFGERGYLKQDPVNASITKDFLNYAQNFYKKNFSAPHGKITATYDIITLLAHL